MFVCSYIGIRKLTTCNYINFLISCIGIAFAFTKFRDALVVIKKQKRGPENARGLSEFSSLVFCKCKFTHKGLNKISTFPAIKPADILP